MNAPISMRAQRGATLIVGLIMLVLLTLVVTAAFTLSTGNLRAVGNMQFRNEAIAAANTAAEDVLSSLLTGGSTVQPPAQPHIGVDINGDSVADYFVDVAAPTCIRATVAAAAASSSLSLGAAMSTSAFWNTIWDIDATVNDAATGASIRVRQGVRVLLTQGQKDSVCP